MTLFPSAFRTDRPWAMGTPARPGRSLRNLVSRLVTRKAPRATPAFSVVTPQANGTHHERPEPLLKWEDPHTAPDGDFGAWAVPNAELTTAGIPGRADPWDAVSEFALSYDGYGYWDDLPELASRVLQCWTRSRSLPGTLDELRGCLFYEQRRWHHFGEEPSGRSAEYMRAIVEAIAALSATRPRTTTRPADPRPATAPETHVKLVAARAVALRPLHSRALTLRPVPASMGRLVPVPAAEAHVRLVSAIEEQAGAMSRHPSGQSSRGSSGHTSEHPSMARAVGDLKPMPSAEPLPKPPVIVRRSRDAVPGPPNRPGGVANARRTSADQPTSNGSQRGLESRPGPSTPPPAEVTPLCREFSPDDTGYRAWVDSHPQGFVLNQPRTPRPQAPTLHRVGCAALAGRDGGPQTLTDRAIKVGSPSADTLKAWSVARGTGAPTTCRRCNP
jgi:hypothetical protein